MAITKKIIQKDAQGNVIEVDIGANATNITEDSKHRFVTDAEKESWSTKQNVFSNITVGSTTIAADNTTDTLTLVEGSNVTLTADTAGDKVTISATDTKYTVATTNSLGLVKSGTDITVDSNGNVSVVDDSHNHVISNIDELQTALDGKANSSHIHRDYMSQNAEAFDNTKHFDTYVTPGQYDIRACTNIVALGGPQGAYYNGRLLVFASKSFDGVDYGSITQILLSDSYSRIFYRMKQSWGWDSWYEMKDTIYTHPTTPGDKHIPAGGSSGQILKWNGSGAATWEDEKNTTYQLVTANENGLMSALDKVKLDGISKEWKVVTTNYADWNTRGLYFLVDSARGIAHVSGSIKYIGTSNTVEQTHYVFDLYGDIPTPMSQLAIPLCHGGGNYTFVPAGTGQPFAPPSTFTLHAKLYSNKLFYLDFSYRYA